jgi:CBS domain containing-hemolysin-like protein
VNVEHTHGMHARATHARAAQVLVALVLGNAAVNALLTLCLDRLLNPMAAVLLSSTAVVVFSEILPQAVVSRRAPREKREGAAAHAGLVRGKRPSLRRA